jgi:hypothetical protein
MDENSKSLNDLRAAYARGELTLYLGAGVSIGSGLPSWDKLVLAMYFIALDGDWEYRLKPYPNYLYSIAEWLLRNRNEPAGITAQKVRQQYDNEIEFLQDLHDALYAGINVSSTPQQLRAANPLLNRLAEICGNSRVGGQGIQTVVTYNYDNLLEIATGNTRCPFFPEQRMSPTPEINRKQVFHVHGYIPMVAVGSNLETHNIIFTEEQYHFAANDPYSWSNLCQIQCLSISVGLMVGLSLSDPNIRRLLSALKRTPLKKPCFALLKRPDRLSATDNDVASISDNAKSYFDKFPGAGIKPVLKSDAEIRAILDLVNDADEKVHQETLEALGVIPIWYDRHEEVPGLIEMIQKVDPS